MGCWPFRLESVRERADVDELAPCSRFSSDTHWGSLWHFAVV